jgi:hypothetical protein
MAAEKAMSDNALTVHVAGMLVLMLMLTVVVGVAAEASPAASHAPAATLPAHTGASTASRARRKNVGGGLSGEVMGEGRREGSIAWSGAIST